MKNFQHLICLALFCFILTNARAQNQNDQAMKPWIDYMTPGEQHKMMAKSVGDWKADVSTMMNPTQPPMKSQATVHNEIQPNNAEHQAARDYIRSRSVPSRKRSM